MFHAGLALELSRIIWDDRRAEARRGRPTRGRSERSLRTRRDSALEPRLLAAPMSAVEDPWWLWRVVEPDAAYLRRRAAA